MAASSSSTHPFLAALHPDSTLPEHHDALSVMESLDDLWFCHNVFRLPCRFPSFCFPLSSSSSSPSPFQSIELVTPSELSSASRSRAAEHPLPRARFENIPIIVKKRESSWPPKSLLRNLQKSNTHASLPSKQSGKPADKHQLHDAGRKPKARLAPVYPHVQRKLLEYEGTVRSQVPNLEPLSGKQLRVRAVNTNHSQERQEKRDWRRGLKNVADFAFDELKGIRDLGFSFNKDNLTPRVVSVFPGLRRQLQGTVDIKDVSIVTPMKYRQVPSNAWWIQRQDALTINWRMPEEGVDMKEHLKFWARAVASVVRQEC